LCPPDLSKASDPSTTALIEALWRGEGRIDPPHKDHVEFFYELMPLSTGAFFAFCSAYVLMPYLITEHEWRNKVKEVKIYADQVGWNCAEHNDWSWYYPGKTGLIILQPKTPIQETLALFDSSFRKFAIEFKKKYEINQLPYLTEVVESIADDACFPLDVRNFNELYENFIRKYYHMRFDPEDPDDNAHIEAYKFLFAEWEQSRQ